ncbi:FadR/GntR family transcriptional regulator [Clostridium sp. E02]|uniref:FadR/GntR family transcriptional regulator n=1 Tax=Clostridium sp. E02 TaxID=2487134 RepID=UPI000F538CC2|nr:FadR/GntR family transcriptional regulator [Clostridium sp. E02]
MILHSNVTNQLVQYFKDNINSGNWKVGEKIPSENQLREILGVSRASVRTAVQQLVGLGVLETKHGKGTFLLDDQVDDITGSGNKITSEDCQDILKVLEFRRIVESEACFLAAEHVTPELIQTLQGYLEEMAANKEKKEAFVTADIEFHEAICAASENPLLEKSMVKVFEETRKNHSQMHDIFGFKDGIYYHTLILSALKDGDSKKARKLMYEHLQNGMDQLI